MNETAELSTHDRFCGIHTGLRKGSDTDWSVLLWNLITVVDDAVWAAIVDCAAAAYEGMDEENPVQRLRYAMAAEPDFEKDNERWKLVRSNGGIAVQKAFEMCDDATLADVAAFIGLTD